MLATVATIVIMLILIFISFYLGVRVGFERAVDAMQKELTREVFSSDAEQRKQKEKFKKEWQKWGDK